LIAEVASVDAGLFQPQRTFVLDHVLFADRPEPIPEKKKRGYFSNDGGLPRCHPARSCCPHRGQQRSRRTPC